MNKLVETILDHRSIRSFEDKLLSKEQIETMVLCAQAASTSSYIQAYTIIGVTDPEKKAALAEIAGPQTYVEKNGHLFIFCADLQRLQRAAEMENADVTEALESTEKFLVASIDAALAAQNAAIAAESMGLGICYIGGLRNNLPEVSKLLGIPKRVIPLFGLVAGYPTNPSAKKPRLPLENIYHENEYQSDPGVFNEQLEQFNRTIRSYYLKRSNGLRKDNWTCQMTAMLGKKLRLYMKDYVESQGLNKR
ncbi:oxygen-insensitive NADPH nitroreductase [Peribacillus psychrosaccharolyticus]|uniref:oxygen-insensitive NADPH nitroreductase n=1 Tax=Peribacillus psychrosaccharolyticus TaxID=1407 RepID=UPI003D28E21B